MVGGGVGESEVVHTQNHMSHDQQNNTNSYIPQSMRVQEATPVDPQEQTQYIQNTFS